MRSPFNSISLSVSLGIVGTKNLPPQRCASSRGGCPSRQILAAAAMSLEKPATNYAHAMEKLQRDVYGDWENGDGFPAPMPPSEAGSSDFTHQRRYLWTDAFGVLNFVSMAERAREQAAAAAAPAPASGSAVSAGASTGSGGSECDAGRVHLCAAVLLIDAVHQTLGRPSSPRFPMLADESGHPRSTGYKGLRIGKAKSRRGSDAGMEYDGMYWHYMDKWLFALLRCSQATDDPALLEDAVRIIRQVHEHFIVRRERDGRAIGLHWKLDVDLSPIRGLETALPGDDALSAWVVYSLILQEVKRHLSADGGGVGDEMGGGGEANGGGEVGDSCEKEGGGGGGGGGKAGGGGGGGEGSCSAFLAESVAPLENMVKELGAVTDLLTRVENPPRPVTDGLGWGLRQWKLQWLRGPWAERLRLALAPYAGVVLDPRLGMQLPFRLYGALLGARLSGSSAIADSAWRVAVDVMPVTLAQPPTSPHASINKVMLTAVLDPLAFARDPARDPELPIGGGGVEGGV
ncbi:unnamed protein product [Phaeothamnion confervicola]